MENSSDIRWQARRRRTFAIISHPDAGKTTLTEKLLLYGGAIQEAGAVKARSGRRSATSDWMSMEQQRGISITATVLQFPYQDHVINLLDTPGHRDFSEDTYRVLAAADAAVMVLDAAKGVEARTLDLFRVCRQRRIPLLTFVNKYDRPGLDPLELLDHIEGEIGIETAPATWPVGIPGDFRGVIDRSNGDFVRFVRTARGATEAGEERLGAGDAAASEGAAWETASEELELLEATGADVDPELFLAGEQTPVFFGSALTNFGVRMLLDALVELAPPPTDRLDTTDRPRPLDSGLSAQVFKVQANMDPSHRDHVAFVRIHSGRFVRGMALTVERTGKPVGTKYAQQVFGSERETVEEAFPGDVVGLVNAAELLVGDTIFEGEPVSFPPIPRFAPELFMTMRCLDTARAKQFRRGIDQLDTEGVVQLMRDPGGNDPAPLVGAVGALQFEVAAHRLLNEFGAPVEVSPAPWTVARRTDAESAKLMATLPGCRLAARTDGELLALFESTFWLERLAAERPELVLEPVVDDQPVRS